MRTTQTVSEGLLGSVLRARPLGGLKFHHDSQERPLDVHIIIVNTAKSSTTPVISCAETESETHIAWTHYLRF
jgi:hypothetical protein